MLRLSHHFFSENTDLPVLVFLHGLFGSSANWMSIARSFRDEYRVLVPDLRNHGDSFHSKDVSYQAMSNDVWGLLDHLGMDVVALVGHSMGGKVAMHMALERPDRITGLGVVDIAPVSYTHDFSTVFAAFARVDLASLKNRGMADEQMAEVIGDPAVRGFLLQNLQRKAHGWQWRINLSALMQGIESVTAFSAPGSSYEGATGFIYGSDSDYVLPRYQKMTETLFPQAGYCQVQNAGHWVYVDQPKSFMRCLMRFLQKIN